MNSKTKFKQVVILAGDIIILYFSLYITLLLRYWEMPAGHVWQNHFGPFSVIFVVWILIFYIARLYDLHSAVNNVKFFQLAFKSIGIAGLLSIAFFYLNPQIGVAPKTNLLIYVLIFAALFSLWRQTYNWLLKSHLPKNNIAIFGLNKMVKELAAVLMEKPHLGYKVSFIVDTGNNEIENYHNIPIIKTLDNLKNLIAADKISTIILTANPYESKDLREILFNCLSLKINYINLPNFYENITGRVLIEVINKMWFLENLSEGNKNWFDIFKRAYDVILALIILILTIIFWPLIGLFIKLESKGTIIFKQMRVGKNNKQFKIYKFRTMANTHNNFSPTINNDKRITKLGSFLRKTRIDEIPQIINILKGEMSFVGPRPERPELIKGLEDKIPFYRERMLVKPGVTGWDQISGEYHSPSPEDSIKKLQYDLFYIKNRSIYLDLSIILKTIATVLSRKGV
ncbi:sugar transferase [Candidatus Falkowbacteria bacterium CG_4_10_14_0_2_um_filter_36_22]|uniref:Bacterial sugar transferase domain-containing protein n=1 Tax=Candidatus Falkowbacteria bacterium CG1_02_37_44 TaxID=1805146 RepID=A0A1J4T364_9BACT|nr:MAG: hypothetical protein AUJ27_04085 [Candidatus Falkowbacteria bacterium CG1_02_37_44]PIX12163.1 MAG: sugar transferase [Candidatus Falkowbacteria bacterium CG_4_8_14_3_um_filter_36_11]PJA10983.1 MAG: sugar transferase [Candidatus Falkowbacteria bacterium CG_4_10_14_0_2_um_filter_36_22]